MGECRILVVDDDPSILGAVAEALALDGYRVDTATNGRQALEKVERGQPEVIVLDMRMPILDGWAFARALQERGDRPKIVVMTAAQNARRWAAEIDASAYLAKPFDLDDLIAKVEWLCQEERRKAA